MWDGENKALATLCGGSIHSFLGFWEIVWTPKCFGDSFAKKASYVGFPSIPQGLGMLG